MFFGLDLHQVHTTAEENEDTVNIFEILRCNLQISSFLCISLVIHERKSHLTDEDSKITQISAHDDHNCCHYLYSYLR